MKRSSKIRFGDVDCQTKDQPSNSDSKLPFDERRVKLLKSKIIQLERQNQLLLDNISSRAVSFEEVDQLLTSMADTCRKHIAKEGCPGPMVDVERADLISVVSQVETARKKMYQQRASSEEIALRSTLLKSCLFSNGSSHTPATEVTLVEATMGDLQHLNLKYVSKLESQLSSLLRELLRLQLSLSVRHSPGETTPGAPVYEDYLLSDIQHHKTEQLSKCCDLLQESAENLMDVSLLHPSAPWGPLKKPLLGIVTVDNVLQSLPKRLSAQTKLRDVLDALIKASNHKQYILQQQLKALRLELDYHKDVYDLQISYCHSLMSALREGYEKFQESSADTIHQPLKKVLLAYSELETEVSESSWTSFLATFKDQVPMLRKTVNLLDSDQLSNKEAFLDGYLCKFNEALRQLGQENQLQKSETSRIKSELKENQDILEQSLKDCLSTTKTSSDVSNRTEDEVADSTTSTSLQTTEVGGNQLVPSPPPSDAAGTFAPPVVPKSRSVASNLPPRSAGDNSSKPNSSRLPMIRYQSKTKLSKRK